MLDVQNLNPSGELFLELVYHYLLFLLLGVIVVPGLTGVA